MWTATDQHEERQESCAMSAFYLAIIWGIFSGTIAATMTLQWHKYSRCLSSNIVRALSRVGALPMRPSQVWIRINISYYIACISGHKRAGMGTNLLRWKLKKGNTYGKAFSGYYYYIIACLLRTDDFQVFVTEGDSP